MAMSIHTAREDELACAIDGAVRLQISSECGDHAAFDCDIHRRDTFGARDAPAFDDQIVLGQ
jgi:hypothetical protein